MKKWAVCAYIALATCVLAGGTVFAAAIGTESDPLVSKSYVDSKISEVLTLINGTGGTTTATDTDAIVAEVLAKINDSDATGGSVAALGYVPVSVQVGQTIYGNEGTELILRAGKGTAVINGVDGVVDITTGGELLNGGKAVKNHLLIVPRDDGRGIKVTEAAWFLVKGGYEIK